MKTIDIDSILAQFEIKGTVKEVKPLGEGLINDTYCVITEENTPDYVLQRINNAIFQDVDLLQHNIEVSCLYDNTAHYQLSNLPSVQHLHIFHR